ncbi:hypothetical protein SOVF_085920 [Spinacia oleracea]|nr:hypothetical protein SOVF_085920 [Spinacia oleracea]
MFLTTLETSKLQEVRNPKQASSRKSVMLGILLS